jgi:muramoyltetrapeptide carboxypeptidase
LVKFAKKTVLFPPRLSKHAEIAVVAPSGHVNRHALQRGVKILRLCHYKIELLPHVFEKEGIFAGSDEQRLSDLQTALNSPKYQAIVCARGGYGLTRILDKLSFEGFLKHPKWVAGFSDITPLLLAINKLGCASIHSQMLSMPEGNDGFGIQQLHLSLKNAAFDKLIAPFLPQNILGKAEGELIGGNLSLICNSLGTQYEPDTKGKILFFEDLGEHHYHIDRMMVQLDRAGKFKDLAAAVVGKFGKMKDKPEDFGKQTLEEIVLPTLSKYGYPVAFGMPFGHIPENRPLILGATAQLLVNEKQSVLKLLDKNIAL